MEPQFAGSRIAVGVAVLKHDQAGRDGYESDGASGRPAATARTGDEMGKVIVMNWVTLDGVMQGPGRPDEDTRDGFERGGWGIPYGDEASVAKMGERMGGDRAWLFGRRTYEQLLASWNARGGPFKDALNNARKYIASSNPATRLDWPNSTLLRGDIPAAVADLKQSSDTNLVIMGSGGRCEDEFGSCGSAGVGLEGDEMPEHKVGTHEEWQVARDELAKLEAEQAKRNEEITSARRDLPWVRVEKEYEFDTQDGKKT